MKTKSIPSVSDQFRMNANYNACSLESRKIKRYALCLSTPKMQSQMLKHGKRADILENEHMKECFIANKASVDLCTVAATEIQYLAVTTPFV